MTISPTLSKFLSVRATKKVVPAIVNGKRSEAAVAGATFYCSPLLPASSDTLHRPELSSPYKKFETFTIETSLSEGDVLTINSRDYTIRVREIYTTTDIALIHLVLEDEQSHA